jgi:hypothetical protein
MSEALKVGDRVRVRVENPQNGYQVGDKGTVCGWQNWRPLAFTTTSW